MTYQNILYDKDGRIATITLNRPEKLNALSLGVVDEVVAAAEEAEADDSISVIILKGSGRAFSSGADVGSGAPGSQPTLASKMLRYRRYTSQYYKLWNLAKPVLAQVHGYCLAGATDLALSCDIVITAEDALFGLPDVRSMGSVNCHAWTYLVGPQWTKRLFLTGDPIDGKTAERIGLVLKAVPGDQLDAEVKTLAKRIANVPLELIMPHKALVNKVMSMMGHYTAQHMSADAVIITTQSEVNRQFEELAKREGLKAALLWRDSPFGDYSARPRPPKS